MAIYKAVDYKLLLIITALMLTVAVVTASYFVFFAAQNKPACFFEYGIISDSWITDEGYCKSLTIEYILQQPPLWGNPPRTVYFECDEGKHLDLSKGSNIVLRWCYVETVQGYRIRGVSQE